MKGNRAVHIFDEIYFMSHNHFTLWHHRMETFSTFLALCVGHSLVTGEFPSQRPEMRSFVVFLDLHLNKCLSKQCRHQWFRITPCPFWRHCNEPDNLHQYRYMHRKYSACLCTYSCNICVSKLNIWDVKVLGTGNNVNFKPMNWCPRETLIFEMLTRHWQQC